MTRIVFAAALALAVTLPAIQAQAQSVRTFVSTAGSDTNPCTITAPCRHFQAAVNATPAGGEVDALDAGAYGSFTINQAITIEGQGWSYVAPPANGAAITINAVSGSVDIHGVSLNGVGVFNTNGIVFNTGGSLNVENCAVRNFSGVGILFQPNASSSLLVADTLLANNTNNAVEIAPTGSNTITALLNRVEANNNGGNGFAVAGVFSSGGSITATVSESAFTGNTAGIRVNSATGQTVANVTVFHSVVANSVISGIGTGDGIGSSGANATLTIAQSAVTGNPSHGWNTGGAGAIIQTYQDNYFNGNGANNGSLTNVGKQ